MDKNLLKCGDVIRLKKGMNVYTLIPEMFVNPERQDSTMLTKHEIMIGKIFTIPYSNVNKKVLQFLGFEINMETVNKLGQLELTVSYDTSRLEGEYEVCYTSSVVGGIVPESKGHHVIACKKDAPSIEVEFYQTGNFTAMIPTDKIQPLNR